MHLENFELPTGGGNLTIEPWVIRGGMARSEFEGRLDAAHIRFQPISRPAGNTSALRVGAGVEFLFIEEATPHDPPPGLFALSFSLLD
jgi:hypothetical protein